MTTTYISKTEFVEKVMAGIICYVKIGQIPSLGFAEGTDNYEIIQDVVGDLYHQGFSVLDAIALALLSEEVNPHLDEDIALEQMKIIQKRGHRHPRELRYDT